MCYDEKLNDSNYADFGIEQNSVRKGFDQHELSDLAWNLGLSKKASEILASRLNEKNLLEKGEKTSYFRYRESAFFSIFHVTVALCIAMTSGFTGGIGDSDLQFN